MIIQHNISALNAYNQWAQHSKRAATSLGRLSSGYRINSAADDPAGLAVSEKMRAQLAVLGRQKENAMDSISSMQIQDGSQAEVQNMILRMQDLATQSMNGVLDDNDRKHLNEEYQQLLEEIDHINGQTNNNSISLFRKQDRSVVKTESEDTLTFRGGNITAYLDALDKLLADISLAAKDGDTKKLAELGVDNSLATDKDKVQQAVLKFTRENAQSLLDSGGEGQEAIIKLEGGDIKVSLLYADSKDLGLAGTNIADVSSASTALDALKKAGGIVSNQRAQYGAVMNRLEHSINSMTAMEENLAAACSRITDADMAKEMTEFTRAKAMEQAAMFVMTHAVEQPRQVLQLLNAV